MVNIFTKTISDIEISFYQSIQNNPHFDFILFPQKIKQNVASFEFLNNGNIINADKKYYLKAIEGIAKFHHYSQSINFDFIKADKKYYYDSLKNTLQYFQLPKKQLKYFEKSLNLISNFQIIHDDFLPQNVLIDKNEIKIIDWENIRFGFSEHDIGRFLGDLDSKNPKWNKKYYPLEWHDDLKQKYLITRQQLDSKYDVSKGNLLIDLGELWNYLGPIEMSLKNKDTQNVWFKANLEALQNTDLLL